MGLAQRVLGHIAVLRGRYRVSLNHYESAIGYFDQAGSAAESALTRSGGIGALIYLGDYARVEEWTQAARGYFTEANDELRLARLEGNYALALFRQDRFPEAYATYERVHRVMERMGRPIDIANALWNKSTCLISLGDFTAAAAAYHEARDFARRHGMTQQVAAVDYNVAYLHYLCGDYTDAIRLYAEARKTGTPYRLALCDLDEAEMYLELNLHREAAGLAERARRRFRRLGLAYELGKATAFLAIAEGQAGRLDRAHRAIASGRRTFTKLNNGVWLALLDLYQAILFDRANHLSKSWALAQRALSFFEKSPFTGKAATIELLLARLELRMGRLASAYSRCRRVAGEIQGLGSPSLEYQAAQLEAEIVETMGDRKEARRAYEAARNRLEQLRFRLRGDEIKIAFLKDKLSVYENLFWLTLSDPEEHGRIAKAFQVAELAKSRAMTELVRSPRQGAAPDLGQLRQELEVLYRQLERDELAARPASEESIRKLRSSVSQQETLLAGRLAASNALRPGGDPAATLTNADEIRQWLPEGTQLIEYFVSRGTVFLFLIDRRQIRVWPLAPVERVRQHVRYLRFQLLRRVSAGDAGGHSAARVRRHLEHLYSDLVEPVRPWLTGQHLVVIPHGVLHGIPFAALGRDGRYLIEDFAVSSAPSAELLRLTANRERVQAGAGSLVLGVADERAPSIEAEARAVAAILPDSRLFLGKDASAERLQEHGGRSRYVHIAAHGYFHRENALFSSIRLGDGRLTVFDLHQFDLPADLITLSGCSTGLTEVLGADELVGLIRGLFQAGAGSALVSLWEVHDEATASFMTSFYHRLVVLAEPPVEAFRGAALELKAVHPDPYHWAGFCFVGLGREG
ncbi:MAG: CHAT domain-containing protein [Bryobacterales bacterium]|nr:CHAT domain-containing protein [Bryobacterales bacterium]